MKLLVLDDRSRITPMTEDSCQWGYFHCPDVGGDDFIYANLSTCVAFCGADGTKSQVLTLCNNNCVAACVPGGEWFAC